MTTSDDAVTRRLMEIADRTNRRVTQQGTRLDAHARELAGHRQVARTVVGHTADIRRIDGRLVEITEGLDQTSGRAEMAATAAVSAHDRLDGHENRLNQIDSPFPWIEWGGITAAAFLVSMLFWRVVMYGGNWHPWLEDRGGAEYWQRQHPSLLNFQWWIVVISTTLLVAGIAVLFIRSDNNQPDGDGDHEAANAEPVVLTTTPVVAPELPPAVARTSDSTLVYSPDQQPALH